MMKKTSLVLALVLSVIISTAQTWTNVNGRWGYEWLRTTKALFIPSGNGAPSGTASLNGAMYKGQAAFYSDTTAKKIYMFNPKDSTWTDITATGGGTPGGSTTQVQFNSAGAFAGDAGLIYDATTNKLTTDSIRSIKNIPDTVHVGLFDKDAVDSAWYFGTSITAGTAATTAAGRYSKLVSDQLRVVEINFGHGGYMLQKPPGWPLSNSFMDLYATEIPTKLAGRKYLFFAWGENDSYNEYLFPGFGLDTFQFKNDYKTIVNFAIAAGWPKSAIKIISPFWQLTSRIPLATQQKYFIAAKWFADSSGIQFIDVYTQGKSYDKLFVTDGVHPTNVGHQFHALSIYSQISQNMQIKSGENVVNAGTTVVSKLYNLGKDTASGSFYLGGYNSDGLSVKVPKERFIMLDNNNIATQSGNASVLGSISAGVAIRAGGQPLFSSGSGFEMYYNGADGLLAPLNRDASTSGNIFMPFSKLVIGSSAPATPFTQLYVVGTAFGRGVFSSGNGNVIYNSNTNEVTLNMLVSGDSVGHIATFGPAAGGSYGRTAINALTTKPVTIGTLSDNGSGAMLQINGKISVSAHTIASNSDSAVVWNRSLKAYEYAKINGTSYTFANGLAESSGTISWGGTLTGTTTINGASNFLGLGASGSKLSGINIFSSGKINLYGQVLHGVEDYSTDADHALTDNVGIIELHDNLTTNRTLTMPTASQQGQIITIVTRFSAGSSHYILASAVTDNATGSTFTQLDWGKTYDFYVNSSAQWLLIRKY